MLPLFPACAGTQAPPATITAPAFASDRIQVNVVGTGPDVVLIPGLGSSPAVWESTIDALPGYRYHLIHVDGFAGAPPRANAEGPLIAPVAEEIARYIAASKLDQPTLIGHSLGGTLAMLVAARHEGLAARVMVVDMVPFVGAMVVPGATAESIAPIAAITRAALADPSKSEEQRTREVQQTIGGMIKTENMRETAIADSLASDQQVSAQAMYDLMTTDLRPELANVAVPMKVLWVSPPSIPLNSEQMAELYSQSFSAAPSAELIYFEDSYHFIMHDAPDKFQREVSEFLTSPER